MFYVYLMRAGKSHYKIGVTKDLKSRVKAIQAGNPEPVYLVSSKLVDLPYSIETELHQRLTDLAAGGGREWFTLKDQDVIELCIFIQTYPHIELNEKIIIRDLLDRQLMWKKTIEKKIDLILNNYQKRTFAPKPPVQFGEEEQNIEPLYSQKPTKEELDEELVQRAIPLIQAKKRASTSLLQRQLGVGYGRASRAMDIMEERGIIAMSDGTNRPRQVLV